MTERPLRNLSKLTPELAEKAKKELNEDPEERLKAIESLKEMFAKEHPELKLEREDDLFLIRFLRSRKFNLKNALEILVNYHKFPLDFPFFATIFANPTYENAKVLTDLQLMGILPGRARNGSLVIYIKPGNIDVEKITPEGLQKGTRFLLEKMLDNEETQICGVTFLENMNDFSLMKTMQFDQSSKSMQQKDQFHYLQNCLPVRLKGIHAVDQPIYVSVFMAIVKPFLKQKLRERIFFHGSDHEEVGKHIDLQYVPTEIGGKLNYDFHSTFAILDQL